MSQQLLINCTVANIVLEIYIYRNTHLVGLRAADNFVEDNHYYLVRKASLTDDRGGFADGPIVRLQGSGTVDLDYNILLGNNTALSTTTKRS